MTRPGYHQPRYLFTPIPNRIYVGEIDHTTTENDLWHMFSPFGTVKEVKIVVDRAGLPKGYGFVTFETQEDAQKILQADRICFKDKMYSISHAVQKQSVGRHTECFLAPRPSPGMAWAGQTYQTPTNGYPYTFYKGAAYFQSLDMSTPALHWPPIYQQPACQCIPNHSNQQAVPQTPVASNPVMYMQPSGYAYQPTEQPSDGGRVQQAGPVLEATVQEQLMDHMMQPASHHMYTLTPGATAPVVMQQQL